MTQKEKARPVTAITEQAEAAAPGGAATSSTRNCTTSAGVRQVHEVLLQGAENALDGRTLTIALGLKDRRELSKQVEWERRSGHPICASVAGTRGYYLAANPAELQRYISSLDRRIRAVRATRDACAETLRRMSGQETMRGW